MSLVWCYKRSTLCNTLIPLFILSPLLFDVDVDLDENNPSSYTIRVGPVLHKNLFDSENTDDSCYTSEAEIQKQFVDLENIYEDYTTCKVWSENILRFYKSYIN